jgi:hypothetical protein
MKKLFVPIIAATMMFAAACNSDSTSPTVSLQGTWNLRTVNGFTLPAQPSGGGTLSSEQLTLNPDGTFTDAGVFNGSTFVDTGFYTVSGNLLTFTDQTAGFTYQGSVSGNVLTETPGNDVEVFQKS